LLRLVASFYSTEAQLEGGRTTPDLAMTVAAPDCAQSYSEVLATSQQTRHYQLLALPLGLKAGHESLLLLPLQQQDLRSRVLRPRRLLAVGAPESLHRARCQVALL
jgi:hypothetical protein